MSEGWSGREVGNNYGKVGKEKEFAIGECSSLCNDIVMRVGNETKALSGVEMRSVVCIAKKEDGQKADGRVGHVERIVESEAARRGLEFNSPHGEGVNGYISKTFDGMCRDVSYVFKV